MKFFIESQFDYCFMIGVKKEIKYFYECSLRIQYFIKIVKTFLKT